MQELKQGTPLQGGKYIIKRVLGQGGFGITYLAEQVSLGREVAVKEFFMKDNCMRDDASGAMTVPTTGSSVQVDRYREKFMKEARTLASLDHPNIVNVIDVFEENGTVYFSMPYLPGGSLKGLVGKQGPLPESEALRYAGQIAEALKYMHQERHICHYDVKPDNVLLDRKGNAVLIDFGISKNYDAQGNETSTTPVGMSEGYAPLEQYQQMVNEFSPASDVYALGATLFFLITGTPPPSAISIAQGAAVVVEKNISSSTRNLIFNSMRTSPTERPKEVDAFIKREEDTSGTNIIAPVKLKPEETRTQKKTNDETIIDSERKPALVSSTKLEKKPELMNWQVLFTLLVSAYAINTISILFPNNWSIVVFCICSIFIGSVSILVLSLISKESVHNKILIPAFLLFILFGIMDDNGAEAFFDIPFIMVFTIIMSYWDEHALNRSIWKKVLFCIATAGVYVLIAVLVVLVVKDLSDKGVMQANESKALIITNIICILFILMSAFIYYYKRKFSKASKKEYIKQLYDKRRKQHSGK